MGTPCSMKFILAIIVFSGLLALTSGVSALTPKEIYRKAGPAVVFIFATDGSGKGSGGTGSIIREDGLVLTNAHILKMKGSDKLLPRITIYLKPERISGNHEKDLKNGYTGRILAHDSALDLALLKIGRPSRLLKTLDFADSQGVEIGDRVFAIGHPEQGGLWSLTTGVISAFRLNQGGVQGKNLFQTDASINRGNSGGPLLNENGEMVGINAMIARTAADGLTITDVNFSIRSDVAIRWLGEKGYRFTPKEMIAEEERRQEPESPSTGIAQAEPAPAPIPQKTEPSIPSPVSPAPEPRTEHSRLPESETTAEKAPGDGKSEDGGDAGVAKPDEPARHSPKTADDSRQSDKPEAGSASPGAEKPQSDGESPEKRILTEKKPYNMDALIEGMQEMEDLMEEMRDFMEDFKKRN